MTRLNFTQRKRITRDRVDLVLATDQVPPRVNAHVDVRDLGIPDGDVVIEAYHQTRSTRISAGTVLTPQEASATLHDFPDVTLIKFRVKVVGPQDERGLRPLLAVADRLVPRTDGEDDAPREPLLPFRGSHDLGQEVWRLDFSGEEPAVEVNANLGDWRGFVQEPYFQALVFPELFRQVLLWLSSQEDDEPEGAGARWRSFLEELGVQAPPTDAQDEETLRDWANEAAAKLARRHGWFDALNALRGQAGD